MVPTSAAPPVSPSTLQATPAFAEWETVTSNCLLAPGTSDAEAGLILIWSVDDGRLPAASPPLPHAPSHRQRLSSATRPMADADAFVGGSMPPPSTPCVDSNRRQPIESGPGLP